MQERKEIIRYLQKHHIHVKQLDNELVIQCPFCKQIDGAGNILLTFHINPETGSGDCWELKCLKKCDFHELAEKLGMPFTPRSDPDSENPQPHKSSASSRKNQNMPPLHNTNDILEALQSDTSVSSVSLTGIIDNRFYHTVFVRQGFQYSAIVIFDDGAILPVRLHEERRLSFFEYGSRTYFFNIGGKLWFQDGVVNTINNAGILRCANRLQIAKHELYKRIETALSDYYDFFHEEELHICITHIVHSYILGILGKTFNLTLDGDKDTGKSSLQLVLSYLEYNGCFGGKTSVASLVRKEHFFQAALHIDELDKIGGENRTTMIGVLNSGHYSAGTYEFVNMNRKEISDQIVILRTFGTKTFSTNKFSDFDPTFISRCIVIHTARNRRQVKNIWSPSEHELNRFQELRNDIFRYCLFHGKEILKDIAATQTSLEAEKRFGRRTDIFSIVGGISRHFQVDKDILGFLKGREGLDADEKQHDRGYLVMQFIAERIIAVHTKESEIAFTNEEVVNYLCEKLGMVSGMEFAPTASSVGNILKRLKIVERDSERQRIKSGDDKGRYAYKVSRIKLADIIARSGHTGIQEILSESSRDDPKENGETDTDTEQMFSWPI